MAKKNKAAGKVGGWAADINEKGRDETPGGGVICLPWEHSLVFTTSMQARDVKPKIQTYRIIIIKKVGLK